jgi:hypothetical protein
MMMMTTTVCSFVLEYRRRMDDDDVVVVVVGIILHPVSFDWRKPPLRRIDGGVKKINVYSISNYCSHHSHPKNRWTNATNIIRSLCVMRSDGLNDRSCKKVGD